ncbi:MAG: hypothetical protein K9L70_04095 [Thiohalocapsa sp.]|nr:hypothetical protein [Thiohalocapsa sp.]MCF7992099.1 hypothetical protein [Thiohalocapsa sp.]
MLGGDDRDKTRRRSRRKGRLEIAGLFGGSALIAIAGILVALQFVKPAPPKTITIAAGAENGAYFGYARRYAAALAENGIELQVLATEGSVDNLRRLLDETDPVDVALVQSGVADEAQKAELSGLGSMFYEPLWLLAPAGEPVSALNTLAGSRICVGPTDSGSRFLALRLLGANGIDAGNAEILAEDLDTCAEQLADGALDLMFAVGSADSPLLQRLSRDDALTLQDLPRAEAYARRDSTLSALTLPTGALDLAYNVPREDLSLIAATANLVVRPDIHPALVDLLIRAAGEVHGRGSLFAEPGTFPTPRHGDFPLNADAERYYENGPPFLQRYLPFWAATWIDRTKVMLVPLLALLFPLVKVLPPVYRWRIRRRILRWYVELRRIDKEVEGGAPDAEAVEAYKRRLATIESDAAQIDVPVSYSDQLYNLRLHIRLLAQKLERVGNQMPIA